VCIAGLYRLRLHHHPHQQHRPLNQMQPELLSIAFVTAHLLAYVSGSANLSSKQRSTMPTSVQEIQSAEAYMQGTQHAIRHTVNFHSPFCIQQTIHSMQRSAVPTYAHFC
jgi:hypothetical protein